MGCFVNLEPTQSVIWPPLLGSSPQLNDHLVPFHSYSPENPTVRASALLSLYPNQMQSGFQHSFETVLE